MANMTIVNGYISRNTELRTTKNGDKVCDVWFAHNKETKSVDENGNEVIKKKVAWYKATLWREYAQTMAQYLTKGRKILVTGEPEPAYYVDRESNQVRPYTQLNLVNIEFEGPKPENDGTPVSNADCPWGPGEEE